MIRRLALVPLAILAAIVVACGGTTGTPTAGTPTASAPTGSLDAGASASRPPTSAGAPSSEPSDVPSEAPPSGPPSEPPTGGPTGSEGPAVEPSGTAPAEDPAAACTGSDENRAFFAAAAAALDWPVLCLSHDGWFVTKGTYRLADGGHLDIGYRGPDGATLSFREGYICDAEGCAPQGTILRDATLGELGNAQLIELDDGTVAVVADPDANPSWILIGSGMTAEELETVAAGFATVGG